MAENSNTPARTTTRAVASSFNLKKSDETLNLSKDLANFIKEKKLTTQVQGKDFVNVEGWQYAGSRLGIVPIVEEVTNLSTDAELKYQARVSLYDLNNKATVGAGFAVCSNKEQGKKFYQEFAICSMAQTRAVGKAYRNILAWIIRAAGYEPTPAEELEYDGNAPEPGTGAMVVAESPKKSAAQPENEQPAPVLAHPAASAGAAPSSAEPAPMPLNADFKQPALAAQPTPTQVTTIKSLLNNPVITGEERSKTLAGISKMDQQRAAECIQKLEKAIQDRTQQPASAPAVSAEKGSQPLSRHQREDLIWLINRPAITTEEKKELRLEYGKYTRQQAEAKKAELRQLIAERTPNEVVPAVLAGEDFTAAAKELLDFTRKNADVLGHEAYEDAYLHVQGQTVTAAELRASLKRHQEAFEALAA